MAADIDIEKISKALNDAVALHQAGDVQSAATHYEALRPTLANHPELHYLLGAAYVHLGRADEAVPVLERSLALRPDHVATVEMLGSAWIRLENPANALVYFEQAVKLKPRAIDALCRLGATLAACGRHGDTLYAFECARAIDPNHPEAMTGAGHALHNLGRVDEAEDILRRCIEVNPSYAQAYTVLGGIWVDSERLTEAERLLRQCLLTCPEHVVAQHYLALALHRQGKLQDAEHAYRKALSLGASDTFLFTHLGDVLADLGRLDDAESVLADALAIAPDDAGLLTGMGRIEELRGNMDKALSFHNRAIAADNGHADAFINRGNAYKFSGDLESALKDYDTAFRLNPNLSAAAANRGMTLLTLGRLDEGWPAFKARIKARAGSVDLSNGVSWDGSPLDGKNILVWAEYGLGDEILFANLLPDLIARVGKCTLICSPRLVSLFKRSFPGASVQALGTPIEGDFDARLPLTDTAQWLRPSLDSFPAHHGYINADPALTAKLRQRYQTSNDQKVVGLSWHSGGSIGTAPFKSIALESWAPVLNCSDIKFVSLQYGDCTNEVRRVNQTQGSDIDLDPDIDSSGDMEAFAAQVAAMDLVISVSNTTVHVAGALGKPVWALVPKGPGAHWYWFQNRDDSPWYPSLRMFRQKNSGQWDDVLVEVAGQLSLWRQS